MRFGILPLSRRESRASRFVAEPSSWFWLVAVSVVLYAMVVGVSRATSSPTVPGAVPAGFQRLYTMLEAQLAAIHPGDPTHGSVTTLGAELQIANGNRGRALLKPATLRRVALELDEFRQLGIGSVTVSVSYPLLDPVRFPRFPGQVRGW
jgi:hypothetical protein